MKKSLFFGMAAILMAGISSCSNEEELIVEQQRPTPYDHDQSLFVNIDIHSTESMTRAGQLDTDYGTDGDGNTLYDPDKEPNFSSGTAQENKVQTIFLIFYDTDGNRVSTTQVRKDNLNDGTVRNPSENSLYKGIVQIDVKHGSLPPRYVMCFINPITSMNFEINEEFASLDALQKATRPRIIDDNNNFAMSKSVYYGVDRSREDFSESMIGNSRYYEKIVATPLASTQLFTNREDAETALESDGDSMVDIFVERYAAKVNFNIDESAVMNVRLDNNTTLTFVPEYWAVNAYESDTYICKSFLEQGLAKDMSYTTMNDALGGKDAWFWNSPDHHRCFWAQTPAYYKQEYPRVADDIIDNRADASDYDDNAGFALGYYSYDQMKKNASDALIAKAKSVKPGTQTTIYARENTVAGSALQEAAENSLASPKAAIASAVLVGHYKIGNKEIPANQTFYVSGNATNGYTLYEDDDAMLTWFVNTTVRFATNARGTASFYDYGIENYGFNNDEYKDYFKIEHPQKAVRTLSITNPAVIDSRFVTIQLNEEKVLADDHLPFFAYINGNWTPVTKENINLVNQQMLYQAGTVQGFKGGKAFYTIPIKHLGFYRKGNANAGKMGTESNFKWDQVKSGDFGLVRNHVYSITVDQIVGLGNGIPNEFDPIVPPTDPEEYFIGARIIVLNWAVVPEQHVTL